MRWWFWARSWWCSHVTRYVGNIFCITWVLAIHLDRVKFLRRRWVRLRRLLFEFNWCRVRSRWIEDGVRVYTRLTPIVPIGSQGGKIPVGSGRHVWDWSEVRSNLCNDDLVQVRIVKFVTSLCSGYAWDVWSSRSFQSSCKIAILQPPLPKYTLS